MTTRTTALTLSVLAGLAVVVPAGGAHADPKGGQFTITCGSRTFQVVTSMGKGDFIPAHVVGSTTVLVPVSFGAFIGTVTALTGAPFTESFSDTETVTRKGSGKQRSTACTYTFTEEFTVTAQEAAAEGLPRAGTYQFTGSGQVNLQIRPR